MEGPGVSLFQGNGSIHVNNGNQEEEEEFIQEEKIRKAELKNLIENAFDDLIDDDDEDGLSPSSSYSYSAYDPGSKFHTLGFANFGQSMNRSEASMQHHRSPDRTSLPPVVNGSQDFSKSPGISHYVRCFKNNSLPETNNVQPNYIPPTISSQDQLQVLYEVKLREIEKLNTQLEEEQRLRNQAQHELALAIAEKEGAIISKTQSHDLLVNSKQKILELETRISELSGLLDEANKHKDELKSELDLANLQIASLKQKIDLLERCDIAVNREKRTDAYINSLRSEHEKAITALENKLEIAEQKLVKKEEDCHAVEKKLEEMERKHASMLLNKCDTAMRQETTLQTLLDQANAEKVDLNKKIISLTAECDMLKSDLERFESVKKFRLLGSSSDEQETDSMIHMGIGRPRFDGSKRVLTPQDDTISKLRDELQKALLGQRAKRLEIKRLQEQVQTKEIQIYQMKELERTYHVETEKLKSDMAKIMDQIENAQRSKQNETSKENELISKLRGDIDQLEKDKLFYIDRINELTKEMDTLNKQLIDKEHDEKLLTQQYINFQEHDIEELKMDYEKQLLENDQIWSKKMDELLKECEDVKRMYIEIRTSKNDITKQLEEEKKKSENVLKEQHSIEQKLQHKDFMITTLEEQIINLKQEKESIEQEMKKYSSKQHSSSDQKIIAQLEAEIEKLRHELAELPKKQTQELEALKEELIAAKHRLIELEKKLRQEFENELSKTISENTRLKALLSEKENQVQALILSKSSLSKNNDPEKPCNGDCHEAEKLKCEVQKLKENCSFSYDEVVVKLEDDFSKKLQDELKQLENELVTKHSIELKATEERVKNITVKYFSNEIQNLETAHKNELATLLQKHQTLVDELRKSLKDKDALILRLQANGINASSNQLEKLKNQMEEDRNKAAEIMSQWAKEVQDMKTKTSTYLKEIDDLKQKLKAAKSDKKKLQQKLSQAENNADLKYKEAIASFQSKIQEMVTAKENLIEEKVTALEKYYEEREIELRKKLDKKYTV